MVVAEEMQETVDHQMGQMVVKTLLKIVLKMEAPYGAWPAVSTATDIRNKLAMTGYRLSVCYLCSIPKFAVRAKSAPPRPQSAIKFDLDSFSNRLRFEPIMPRCGQCPASQ